MPLTDYITMNALRNVIDIALVFILVYVVLKLFRGTRAVPTVVGLILLGLLYWISIDQDLATLEFVLRYAVVYIGFAIIVLFQSEIRQALIYFANRLRFPIMKKQRGQFGGSVGEAAYLDCLFVAVDVAAAIRAEAEVQLERHALGEGKCAVEVVH